ncbi:hypothetical protein WJX74_010649 [Apatococcus lobatus]|uniref:CS domain-containing protein n=1 Tax=Apatococcus lobatus TaxID=904363 RepID=A0AAW1SHZ4_9CHLO
MAEKLAPSKRHQYTYQGRTVYEWNQSLEEINLYIEVPPGVSAKQLEVQVTASQLKIGLKGNPPYLDLSFSHRVKSSESFWTLDKTQLNLQLTKAEQGEPWTSLFVGHDINPLTHQVETQRLMLERFQEEHPGFDFSGATFNGQAPNPRTFMGGMSRS